MGTVNWGHTDRHVSAMIRCSRPGCRWQAVAASRDGATDQFAEHLVDAHATVHEGTVPEGMVQVRFDGGEEWLTMTVEDAIVLHALRHDEDGVD